MYYNLWIRFYEKVKPEDFFILKTAVLFHDMGYIDQYENNEKIGAKYAQKFLPEYDTLNPILKRFLN